MINMVRILVFYKYLLSRAYFYGTQLFDDSYWTFVDLAMWGMMGNWMQYADSTMHSAVVMLMCGACFWQIVLRSNNGIFFSVLEEIIGRNLVNTFVTPVSLAEWIIAAIGLALTKSLFSLLFGAVILLVFYKIPLVLCLGFSILPISFILILFGIAQGFLAAGLLIFMGTKIQSLVWALMWMFAPMSAAFSPLNSLPNTLVFFAKLFPLCYAFEGMRIVIKTGMIPWNIFLYGGLLSIVYAACGIAFFVYMFEKSRRAGLDRVT